MEPATKLPLAEEPGRKFVPVTVIVNALAPAATALGLNAVIAGALTVKTLPAEATVPFFTVTLKAAAAASEVEGTVAVIAVAVPVSTVSAVVPR